MDAQDNRLAIVSTDLDGTLLGRGNHRLGTHLSDALLQFETERSVVWVINTGRRYDQLINLVQSAELQRPPDYLVDRETFLHHREGAGYTPVADWNQAAMEQVEQLQELVEPHLASWATQLITMFPGIKVRLDAGVPLSVQCVDIMQSVPVRDTLHAWSSPIAPVRIIRNGIWVAIWAAGYDKGSVLAEISRRHRVPSSRIMAVGDSENDLPMLTQTAAGWPVAPANAEPIVKQFVIRHDGFVSEYPDIDGVLDGLQLFFAGLRECATLATDPRAAK